MDVLLVKKVLVSFPTEKKIYDIHILVLFLLMIIQKLDVVQQLIEAPCQIRLLERTPI